VTSNADQPPPPPPPPTHTQKAAPNSHHCSPPPKTPPLQGLGKTVELLATISAHPFQPPSFKAARGRAAAGAAAAVKPDPGAPAPPAAAVGDKRARGAPRGRWAGGRQLCGSCGGPLAGGATGGGNAGSEGDATDGDDDSDDSDDYEDPGASHRSRGHGYGHHARKRQRGAKGASRARSAAAPPAAAAAAVCSHCARQSVLRQVEEPCGATLVVCPAAILQQWQDELRKHIVPGESCPAWGLLLFCSASCCFAVPPAVLQCLLQVLAGGSPSMAWPVWAGLRRR
jgi:hypothetical protein